MSSKSVIDEMNQEVNIYGYKEARPAEKSNIDQTSQQADVPTGLRPRGMSVVGIPKEVHEELKKKLIDKEK